MYSQIRVFAFLFFVLGISSYLAADIQIHDPGYQAEVFASYQMGGFTGIMIFDSMGNMYITNRDAGTISKIDSAGNLLPAGLRDTGTHSISLKPPEQHTAVILLSATTTPINCIT